MEIEMKYRVANDALVNILKRLEEEGGIYMRSSVEIDTYFNVTGRDSMRTKECLRIRQSPTGQHEMTYKPPTIAPEKGDEYFAKKETNIAIADPALATDFLLCLGNSVLAVVEKSRRYFSLGECIVSIDEIKDLGTFVEVEIDGDDAESGLTKVKKCAKMLGLNDHDIVKEPYRDLVIAHSQSRTP